jgi:hypothetical protein
MNPNQSGKENEPHLLFKKSHLLKKQAGFLLSGKKKKWYENSVGRTKRTFTTKLH